MSPRIFSCPICGWIIYDGEGSVSWMNQFRGLYSCADGIVLTGVGLYTDPGRGAFIAPSDPTARWDDPDYTNPDEDQFGAMKQCEINGRHGFVFHDACWSLLERAFHPAPVLHKRIFEVCDSLPFVMAGDSMNWGHDYGGLAILMDSTHFFPWEERFADREFPDGWFNTPFSADPITVSEVDEILTESPTCTPPSSKDILLTGSVAVLSGNDPFNSLPAELCSAIAAYLPTRDVLNARCASRSFWHVFNSQQFWASRFRGNSDRSWLFESQDHKYAVRDWRWLYRRTVDGRIGQALRNRKRIWNLIQNLAIILELCWNELPSELSPLWQPFPPEENRTWLIVGGSLRDELPNFTQLQYDCRRHRTQQVAIPENISKISASISRVGNLRYIAGISLTTTTGEVVRLGYRDPSERSVQLSGDLAGFNLAVGSGGIHALQCIDRGTREPTAWLGYPDGAPRTERLAVGTRIIALEVGFDGFRMVRIAVAPQQSQISRAPWNDDNKLRCSAIWYPDVPPLSLDLNEDFFLPLQNYTWGFRPLFWSCFGGPGGIHLAHLTKISAGLWSGLIRLDFSFDREVPAECQSFGRHEDSEYGEGVEFPIDGPGGELIDAVEIWQRYPLEDDDADEWFLQEGELAWLKIRTNRGRTWEFGKKKLNRQSHSIVKREIVAAPGTVITGFFGAQVRSARSPLLTFKGKKLTIPAV
ncbi:hypothetical protein C7999DRAFT_17857 [Corynascus novoguineensis]|uniref:F-box domain-containing protein n=1 Tax=Corynascus novoguineensis TaxID=1126955 RepID=A0AAN7CM84_9PEZI|nr:hypothetical protein C7999DRAFT_17857 [Corynascus novoguineensis]